MVFRYSVARWSLLACASLCACAHADIRRFPLATPVTRDQDLDAVAAECAEQSPEVACAPAPYESSFAWDAADNSIFRPMSKFFQAESYGEAENVNAFDEVPDSSWFTNRIGVGSMSPEDVARGYCPEGPELASDPPDRSWLIDRGKDNGANPGFRVSALGTKFMFKTDDAQVERATAATVIASRIYYAAGWWAPCDSIVYFKKSALELLPGLVVKANVGAPRPFDQERLERLLSKTGRRGDRYRAAASRWLPGKPLGPFKYEGVREDDPSDVIPHENRRDLRGARLIAAWLNHFDSREQNSMTTWLAIDPTNPKSPGHVRHWYIDFGDSFGSEWTLDGFSRRHGHAYILDMGYMLEDFATFGAVERPWDRAHREPGLEIFGYFSSRDFDPERWRGEYPNPAFGRMTEADGAWAARIIARFTPAHIEAAVAAGDFTNPAHSEYLLRVLIERRNLLLRRYFAKLSPLTGVALRPGALCAVDLARRSGTYAPSTYRYRAYLSRAGGDAAPVSVTRHTGGHVCLPLASSNPAASVPDEDPRRYIVLTIENGVSRGPLLLHLYDLGTTRGLRLVGIERPESAP
jgi:hypothetical protein